MDTSKIRRDHDALFAGIDALRALMQAGVAENADAISGELGKLSATIRLHLSIEDRMLYPALANAANPDIAAAGKRFRQDMGGLAEAYRTFATRWNARARIAADPDGFRREADAVFEALHARIQHETRELLPLVEQV